MEIIRTIRFLTKLYGSAPSKGYMKVLEKYIVDKMDKELLSFADLNKKKNQEIDQMIIDILSVLHRNEDGYPIVGSWMLAKCLKDTASAIFNAAKNRGHPKRDMIPMLVKLVEPYAMILSNGNGKAITKPDGVDTYAVTIGARGGKAGRSFFKAYEYINPGAVLTFTLHIDDDLIAPDLVDYWLEKCGLVGLGAFRERFGKFEYVEA